MTNPHGEINIDIETGGLVYMPPGYRQFMIDAQGLVHVVPFEFEVRETKVRKPYMTQCFWLVRSQLVETDLDQVTCMFCIGWENTLPTDLAIEDWSRT